MINWINKKLRKWLGIERIETNLSELERLHTDLTTIGVDVHFKSPHMIIIFSKINGGQIRHVDVSFDSIKELTECVKMLKHRYRPKYIYWDASPTAKKYILEEMY